jgi:uncharacterized protein (DUF3820 family)
MRERLTMIPFGPFNGRAVAELPDWYLYQLADRGLPARLAAAVEAELERRAALRRSATKVAA